MKPGRSAETDGPYAATNGTFETVLFINIGER
jgi:hypothetical protein